MAERAVPREIAELLAVQEQGLESQSAENWLMTFFFETKVEQASLG
jgi:hypothetical protein